MNRTPFDTMIVKNISDIDLHIPDFQRAEDNDHIDKIYKKILSTLQTGQEPKLSGCLITAVMPDITILIDGNHRLKAMKKILHDHGHDLKVYIQQIRVSNKEEAEDLFNVTNNSLPVAEMPCGMKRSIVNDFALYFYKKYGGSSLTKGRAPLFTDNPSGTVNRPRINRSKFEHALGKIINYTNDSLNLRVTLDNYILSLNEKTTLYFKRSSNDTASKIDSMLRTADLFECRLGMEFNNDYLSVFCKIFNIPLSDETLKEYKRTKEPIPQALRIAVWNRYCGMNSRISECPFCNETIKIESFHCAHDISESHGGHTTIDNLYPCCANCNLSMGCQTFKSWHSRFK